MAVRQRSGGMVILVVSVVAGLLAAVLSVSFLRGVAGTVTVLVATQEIAPYTPLTPGMFAAQQMPGAAVPADAIKDPSALNGRFVRGLMLPGTVIRQGHLATASGGSGSLAAQLTDTGAPGMRAMAIPVDNATGVGGGVHPGDRIDIVAAVRVEQQNGPTVLYSKTIARNVPVLHRTESDGTSKSTVVVMVTAQQAEDIAFTQVAGTAYLTLAPYRAETEPAKTSGVTPDSFIKRHSETTTGR